MDRNLSRKVAKIEYKKFIKSMPKNYHVSFSDYYHNMFKKVGGTITAGKKTDRSDIISDTDTDLLQNFVTDIETNE